VIDDEEVTDVRPILEMDTAGGDAEDVTLEATQPGGGEAQLDFDLTAEVTPADPRTPLQAPLRLPRTGVQELDQAVQDLEGLLARLDSQSVRMLVVSCATFVTLFLPWYVVTTPGFQQAVPGIETGGILLLLLVLAEIAFIGFERNLRHRIQDTATLLRQMVILFVILAMVYAFWNPGIPPELSYRLSLWALLPALALLAQVLGLFRILPSLRRRAVARTGH
tara:strand:- start:270 stop:935 length:666 start_codon:yes stop_codon:yes gene_type:complete